MTDIEIEGFKKIIKQLEDIRIPICITPESTMLAVNIEGWIEQLVERIEGSIE